jgi:glucose-6-phosphate 1-dehydrogenase
MALPPSVYISASTGLREHVYSPSGQNRLIIEKPFGKDTESSHLLAEALSRHWKEAEMFRIDHYLGKDMVKNLMVLRLVLF